MDPITLGILAALGLLVFKKKPVVPATPPSGITPSGQMPANTVVTQTSESTPPDTYGGETYGGEDTYTGGGDITTSYPTPVPPQAPPPKPEYVPPTVIVTPVYESSPTPVSIVSEKGVTLPTATSSGIYIPKPIPVPTSSGAPSGSGGGPSLPAPLPMTPKFPPPSTFPVLSAPTAPTPAPYSSGVVTGATVVTSPTTTKSTTGGIMIAPAMSPALSGLGRVKLSKPPFSLEVWLKSKSRPVQKARVRPPKPWWEPSNSPSTPTKGMGGII